MKGISLCAECAYYSMKKHKCTRGCTVDPDVSKGDNPSFYLDCPLPEVEEKKQWISCKKQMPKTGTPVLCYCPAYRGNKYNVAYWDGDWFIECYSADQLEQVTHWKPLPGKPEEDDEDE